MAPLGNEQPWSPQSVIEMFPGSGQELVLAKGQYSPAPARSERFLLYCGREKLHKRADVWMTAEGFEAVLAALGTRHSVAVGECDAMYATRPVFAWARIGAALHLWKRGTLIAQFSDEQVRVRSGPFRGWRLFETRAVRACHGYLANGWLERGVALIMQDQSRYLVARKRELSVLLDPTYDGLDLMVDTCWVSGLVAAICQCTLIEKQLDEGL